MRPAERTTGSRLRSQKWKGPTDCSGSRIPRRDFEPTSNSVIRWVWGELSFGRATQGRSALRGVLLATFLDETGPIQSNSVEGTRWGVGAALGTAVFDADNANPLSSRR